MKTNLNLYKEPTFQAKISPKLEKFARDYINYGKNRIKNNYKLNKKLAEIERFGYDNYTINLTKKPIGWGNEYALIAIKDDADTGRGIYITKRNSTKGIIDSLLKLKRNDFNYRMRRNEMYEI